MSQKKPTTNQQLEEMRGMIAGLQPGKVVTVDRELQQQNTSLMLMLYGATAKYGIGTRGNANGVVVTAQVPVLQVPANQTLQWEVAEDGKSVLLYIVAHEIPESPDGSETTAAPDNSPEGDGGSTDSSPAANVSPPEPEPFPGSTSIGDEFEDEMEVGLGD